jgi:hypothetical protein
MTAFKDMLIVILISVKHFNSSCFLLKRGYAKLTASSNRFGTPDLGLLMQLKRESDYKPPRIHRRGRLQ